MAPFALLFPATVIATLLAGWQAAAWSIVVGGLFTWRFILSPDGGLSQTSAAEAASLTLFLVASAMIAAFSEAYRRSTRALEIERAHQALRSTN